MKNQYFGDINDFRKYGFLRCLTGGGQLSLGVCWMLTPSDGTTDGSLTKYLTSPDDWRSLDPPLFDALRRSLIEANERNVALAQSHDLLPRAIYFEQEVPRGRPARAAFMSACLEKLAPSACIFFDPDNGIEVASVAYGSKGSTKYVYWRELVAAFHEGHSLVVYQHYPRQERESFHQRISEEIAARIQPHGLWALATPTVVYFLAAQAHHLASALDGIDSIKAQWSREFSVTDLLDAQQLADALDCPSRTG